MVIALEYLPTCVYLHDLARDDAGGLQLAGPTTTASP